MVFEVVAVLAVTPLDNFEMPSESYLNKNCHQAVLRFHVPGIGFTGIEVAA
jgi:hypothetical protein